MPLVARVRRCTGAALLGAMLTMSGVAAAADGMQSVVSPYDVIETLDRLEKVLDEKGMNVFARVDHEAGAARAGLELRPTAVLIFGNPMVGTPLMNCAQSVAIDLPQKMLAWEDAQGSVHLGWNDPAYLASRHAIEGCDEVLDKVAGALANFAAAATAQ